MLTEPDAVVESEIMRADGAFHRYESQVRSYCRDFPAVFARASGPYLWDVDGRRYVDLLCGAGALNYGHNDARITARVREYLDAGGPIQSLDLYTVAKGQFIDRLVEIVLRPRRIDYVLQFPGPAGTLAVEAALKLARKVTGRSNVGRISATGRGLMSGLRFTSAQTAADVRRKLFDRGVLAELSGGGRVLKLLPPLTMPVADWRSTFDLITEVVSGAVGAPTIAAG
jgi:4-aminobutyrate aminotransferase-like enzyme